MIRRLLVAGLLASIAVPAVAQDQVIMRRTIQAKTKSTGTSTPPTAPSSADSGTLPDGATVFAKYAYCSGDTIGSYCYKFQNHAIVGLGASSDCDTSQGAAYAAEVTAMSVKYLGNPTALTPAGGTPSLNCSAPPGYAFGCNVQTGQEICISIGADGSTDQVDAAKCDSPNTDSSHDGVIAAYGLKSPPYDGSCQVSGKAFFAIQRSCGIYSRDPNDPFTPVTIGDADPYGGGGYQAIQNCYSIDPVNGAVHAAPLNVCQNQAPLTSDQLALAQSLGMFAYDPNATDLGPDGQSCVAPNGTFLRDVQSDSTSAPTGPDADGVCRATRTTVFSLACDNFSGSGPGLSDMSVCQSQIDGWMANFTAALPNGATLDSVSDDKSIAVNWKRTIVTTFPTVCSGG